jgi:hypothetical protein
MSSYLLHLAPPLLHLCSTLRVMWRNKGFAPLLHLLHPLIGWAVVGGADLFNQGGAEKPDYTRGQDHGSLGTTDKMMGLTPFARSAPLAICSTCSTVKTSLPSPGKCTDSPTRGNTSNLMLNKPSGSLLPSRLIRMSHTTGCGFMSRLLCPQTNTLTRPMKRNRWVPIVLVWYVGTVERSISRLLGIFSRILPLG